MSMRVTTRMGPLFSDHLFFKSRRDEFYFDAGGGPHAPYFSLGKQREVR
jgi:hypothetical protein